MATVKRTPINYWPDPECARAFWGQQDLPPYRRLLQDTTDWLEPRPGDRWLDLGCGSGRLTEAIWEKSGGSVNEVVGVDCAAVNEQVFQKIRARIQPPPGDRIRFQCANFANGLDKWEDATFHGAVSGLAIQYAESFSEIHERWTTEAYDRLLVEVLRVLHPGGAFVFSVNVPEPAWGRVALGSFGGVFRARHPGRYLRKSWRMMRYGSWLKREARTGRFHFLSWPVIREKLVATGFTRIEHKITYSRQAYLIRCRKPA